VNKKLIISALLAGGAFRAGDLAAQASTNAGFLLNAHVQNAAVRVGESDSSIETGIGGGITAGYNYNERLGLYLTLDGTRIQDDGDDAVVLAQADLGVRYTFGGTSGALRPYLNAAVSGVALRGEDDDPDTDERVDYTYSGPAFTVGAGLQYFLSPRLALDGGIQASVGKLNSLRIDGDEVDLGPSEIDITTSRLQIGLAWHP
jgi:opacity protein-like surface antigen